MSLLEVTLKVYQQSLVRVKALLDGSLLDAVQRVEFRIREHQQKGVSGERSPSMAVDLVHGLRLVVERMFWKLFIWATKMYLALITKQPFLGYL